MSISRLDKLPLEILLPIVHYLDVEHSPSVLAFSCVCKSLYLAAAPLLFHTIRVSISAHGTLADDVAQQLENYRRRLEYADGYRHVRRVIIDTDHTRCALTAAERGHGDHSTLDGYLDAFDGFELRADRLPLESVHDGKKTAWEPLTELIRRVPRLTDLLHSYSSQFPVYLLTALEEFHPQCRLHLNTFRLLSLCDRITSYYEYRLVSSPNLYSIRVVFDEEVGYESWDDLMFQSDAVMQLVQGLAPNLKEVHRYDLEIDDFFFQDDSVWKQWPGFSHDNGHSNQSRGSLQYLRLNHYSALLIEELTMWNGHTDFSALQTLNLQAGVYHDGLEYLSSIDFSSLRTLAMSIEPPGATRLQTAGYYESLRQFLQHLPPLTTLSLRGWHPALRLESFLDQHSSLRKLQLSMCMYERLTPRDMAQISTYCKNLQDLTITIPRSRGDATEVSLYRTLGTLPDLQSLDLTLDVFDPAVLVYADHLWEHRNHDANCPFSPDDPSFGSFERLICPTVMQARFPRNGHVRDALVNGALDASLACDIFRVISQAKGKGSLPLKRMTVRVKQAEFSTLEHREIFSRVMKHLRQSWRVERNPRDDRPGELVVREIEKKERERVCGLEPWLERIFRRIWPGTEGGNWWEDWYGLPLASGLRNSEPHDGITYEALN